MKAEYLETTGQDWANHISHEMDANGMIYLAVVLGGQPDADILRQAATDSIELLPVLGCRFDEGQDPPAWVPIGEGATWFSVDHADNWQEGFASFQREDPGQGQLAVRLITSHYQPVLCIKLNHAATDGAGAKGYLALLSRLYNARLAGEKLPKSIRQDRGEGRVFAACGIPDFRMALRKDNRAPEPFVTFPYRHTDGRVAHYAFVTFPLAEVQSVPGCTVNDLLMAACARALTHEAGGDQPVVLNMTVDLRRYLTEGDVPVACNLSGMEKVLLTVSQGEPFEETSGKASREAAAIKADRPGLNSAASMAYLRLMSYGKAREILLDSSRKAKAAGTAAPIVSNLGWLYKGEMKFGDIPVTEIIPLTLAMHAPAIMLGAGSYGEKLTLSAGFYEGEREMEYVERFLHRVKDEMTGNER